MISNLRSLIFVSFFVYQINAQIPSTPFNLLSSNTSETSVDLAWDQSENSDNTFTYDVYKDGVFLMNSSSTSLQVNELSGSTMYIFTVKAKDNFNNESPPSNELAVITLDSTLGFCNSSSNIFNEEWIERVQLNTIDNTSSNQAYSDFTSLSTTLYKETEYSISITPTWLDVVWSEAYSVWIDYNLDGDFEDEGEQVWTQNATQDTIVSGNFTVPSSSISGITRMRVSMKYNDIPDPCENFNWGEVEDYAINIVGTNDLIFSNGTWSPEAPSGNAIANDIFILDGNYIIDSDITVNNIEVKSNATITILKNGSLVVNGNLVSNNNVTLESDSDEYSSLIVTGFAAGNVIYKRHINASASGNDLIAPPVLGQQFNDFITENPNIVSNGAGTLFLFGPFDKTTGSYITYANTETAKLRSSNGYRAASTDNSTFTFTGLVTTKDVSAPVSISDSSSPEWNLIGNPYPSYIKLSDFLSLNNSKFNTERAGIYGYDGNATDGWVIWNQAYSDANPNAKIAPGQGFLVGVNSSDINFDFTSNMRVTGNSDDFISGRQPEVNISHLQLQLSNESNFYKTDFYVTDNATLGQDPNYDSEIYGSAPSFSLYSHLVEDNEDKAIGVQSIGNTILSDVIIPLGLHVVAGEQATISISETTLNEEVEIYLEDRQNNTFTLLNNSVYNLNTDIALVGAGRFYLRFTQNSTLNVNKDEFKGIRIYNTNATNTITVKGHLDNNPTLYIYDLQGRLMKVETLESNRSSNNIHASYLSAGVYVVKLKNDYQQKVEKIIVK
ncbi:GEVED domain-containing protein [Winogradskyella sp. PG-2]|uniref:GEVED domain-containing protein n=1 Tax=Winogradskyella sp. PG-2 TaxID=754409 RepID=UPI000458773B|nr:GEVED domain-containing protein [Winogradskyella sp. PG-2]BAO75642.1 hypothetical protein WPG_1412 [Winogradskyella sp. PG-2]